MAAYIGHTVTVELKNSGGKFCGKLIRTDNVKGMIVLSKGNVSHNKLHVCMYSLLLIIYIVHAVHTAHTNHRERNLL